MKETTIPSNKRDKRQIKHSLLLSRLKNLATSTQPQGRANKTRESRTRLGGGIQKHADKNAMKHQRRRRANHLAANMSDLANALPTLESKGISGTADGQDTSAESPKAKRSRSIARQVRVATRARNVTFQDSTMAEEGIKRKPGFQKRMALLSELERKRFEANLANMSPSMADAGQRANEGSRGINANEPHAAMHSKRWSAIRSHVSRALEQEYPTC